MSVAWATPLIIGINVTIFAAMAIKYSTVAGFNEFQLTVWGANSGLLDLSGQWWRLLTYQFLHLNLSHVAVNMLVMWSVGRLTERLYGSAALLLLYLVAGALAGLASIIWNPGQISVGASGSIFAVLGAFLALLLRFRNEVPTSILRNWLPALLFVGYNLIAGAYQPVIDNAAHIGGLIAGFSLGAVMASPLDSRTSISFWRGLAAIVLAAVCAIPALWYLGVFEHRPSTLQAFAATHRWYVDGESKNLLLWQTIAMRMTAGTITNDNAEREFEQSLLPFWTDASARLRTELLHSQHNENPFLSKIADFAEMRRDWARAIVAELRNGNPQNLQTVLDDAQRTNLVQVTLDRLRLRGEADSLPVPLSESPVVIRLKNYLPGFQWTCVYAPDSVRMLAEHIDAGNDGPAQRRAAGCMAQQMFMTGDYARLDAVIKKYSRDLSDLPDGSSRLEGVWKGLDDLFSYGSVTVEDAMWRTAQWRRDVKGSVEPDLVEAMVFRTWAYKARGYGYASSVTPQAQLVYLARAEMAADGLYDLETSAANDPMWYVLSLGVDRDQSFPVVAQREIFNRGAARFPGYLPLYRQMLISLMPRWGGSTDAVDSFIRDVSKKNGNINPATYARLYLAYGNLEGADFNIVKDAKADATTMREGLGELRQRYAGSDYILNATARFACITGETDFYRMLRPSLRGHLSPAAWPDQLSVEKCDGLNR